MRPPGFPGNPPARMPRAPTPARSPPPRPLRGGDVAFRPTQDVGPRDQCISGLNHAAYALPVNASRPGSPQAHASLGSGWWPTLAGWGWIPTGFRTRFRRSHHGILSPLTGLSRHTRWCTVPQPHSDRRSWIRWGIVRLRVQVAQWTDEQPDTELSRLPIPGVKPIPSWNSSRLLIAYAAFFFNVVVSIFSCRFNASRSLGRCR